MKRIITLALVICAVAMVTRPAVGGFQSGNELHKWCGAGWGLCLGYVAGAYDALETQLCVPGESTLDQVAKVVQKYLAEHPERLHRPGSVLVALAIKDAWPCK